MLERPHAESDPGRRQVQRMAEDGATAEVMEEHFSSEPNEFQPLGKQAGPLTFGRYECVFDCGFRGSYKVALGGKVIFMRRPCIFH